MYESKDFYTDDAFNSWKSTYAVSQNVSKFVIIWLKYTQKLQQMFQWSQAAGNLERITRRYQGVQYIGHI